MESDRLLHNDGEDEVIVINQELIKLNVLILGEKVKDSPEKQPDCVVLGDAAQGFNYENLNKAFRVLASQPSAPLFCLGKGKFYREDGHLDHHHHHHHHH